MFRSKTTVKSTMIPDDVADLINEIDAAASPFDERSVAEKEDDVLILVGTEEEDAKIPTNTPSVSSLKNPQQVLSPDSSLLENPDYERQPSLHLPMQVSKLSLEDELTFLEQSIQKCLNMSPEAFMESLIGDVADARPGEEDAADLHVPNNTEVTLQAHGDSTQVNEDDSHDTEFNPFVNIGNRLLDTHDTPQESPRVVAKRALTTVSTTVIQLLTVMVQMLLSCVRHHTKVTGLVLLGCVLGLYLQGWTTQDNIAENIDVLLEETIQGSSITDNSFGGYITWNSSLTEEFTTPKVFPFEAIPKPSQSKFTNMQLIATLIILALYVAGISLLGLRFRFTSNGVLDNHRAHYESLNLKELKNELRKRNLCTSGLHSHLVDRLVDYDNGDGAFAAEIADINIAAMKKNMTIKMLKEKLRSRALPLTGLKEDLITKVWIPARVKELESCKRDKLREVLRKKKLSPSGSKDALIIRLIEAGH